MGLCMASGDSGQPTEQGDHDIGNTGKVARATIIVRNVRTVFPFDKISRHYANVIWPKFDFEGEIVEVLSPFLLIYFYLIGHEL